jgi:hypothetical protein
MTKKSIIVIVIGMIVMACNLGRAAVQVKTATPALTETTTPGLAAPTDTTMPAGPAGVELLAAKANPGSLIVDGQALYWSSCDAWESTNGKIMAMAKGGGPVKTLAEGVACPFTLKADESALYWIDHEGIEGGSHSIYRMAKAGGQPEVVNADASVFRTLMVGDDTLYWWTVDGEGRRMAKNGGQPERLPFPAKYIMALDGGTVYWLNEAKDLIRSQVDGSGALTLMPGSEFATAEVSGHRISKSVTAVYPRPAEVYVKIYTDANPGMVSCTDQHTSLVKLAKDGGEPQDVARADGYADALLAEPYAYFGGNCIEGISRVNLSDQSSERFIEDASPVRLLVRDEGHIYWVAQGDGSIERARK